MRCTAGAAVNPFDFHNAHVFRQLQLGAVNKSFKNFLRWKGCDNGNIFPDRLVGLPLDVQHLFPGQFS